MKYNLQMNNFDVIAKYNLTFFLKMFFFIVLWIELDYIENMYDPIQLVLIFFLY